MRRRHAVGAAGFEPPTVDAEWDGENAAQKAARGKIRDEVFVGEASRAQRELLAEAEPAIGTHGGDTLSGAEHLRHVVVAVKTYRHRAIAASQNQDRTPDVLARRKSCIKDEAWSLAGDQQPPLKLG